MKTAGCFLSICYFLVILPGQVGAQNRPADLFHDAEGNTYHQLFLEFPAKEILEMNYGDDTLPVDGELTGDGYSVIIKNYPGNKSVRLKVVDMNGQIKEVTKSRCFIDPVLLSL